MSDVVRDGIAEETALLEADMRVDRVATGYGVDLLCIDDITERAEDTAADSLDSLRQDLYHAVITRRGQLPGDSLEERAYGVDVVGFLHAGITNTELLSYSAQLVAAFKADDRVATATVTASFANGVLAFTCAITPADPELVDFEFIVAVAPDGTTSLELTS